MLVMLSGKQGSGKTTVAEELCSQWMRLGIPTLRYKFAQPLYEMHDMVYVTAKDYGIEPPAGGKDKDLLQVLGTEWGRNKRGKNLWVRCAQRKIEKMTEVMQETKLFHVVLIDDLRFRNEFDDMGEAIKIRFECHRDVRRGRTPCWREEEDHPSEVDLDYYAAHGKFDLTVATDDNNAVAVVEQVSTFCRTKFPGDFGTKKQASTSKFGTDWGFPHPGPTVRCPR